MTYKHAVSITILTLIIFTSFALPNISKASYEGPLISDVEKQIAELQAKVAELRAQKAAATQAKAATIKAVGTFKVTDSRKASEHVSVTTTTTAESAEFSADLTGDKRVDIKDLQTILASWGACLPSVALTICAADLNKDGVVDATDLQILAKHWSF